MPGARKGAQLDFDFDEFEGFAAPGTTQIPDIFFDKIMTHLADVELRVLLYFFRRTFGFKKYSDNISIGQMVGGIQTKDGRTLDFGCGLSKSGVTKGLRGLLRKNLIVATRRSDAKRGNLPTNYALNMKGSQAPTETDPTGGNENEDEGAQRTPPLSTPVDKGVSTVEDKGSAPGGQGLSTAMDTQVTVTKKQTDKVVNDVTGNDLKSNARNPDRPSAGKSPAAINPRALRAKYRLTDDQIGQVFRLVDKQVDVLGAGERNHGNYVKRAAEAVRDGQGDLLDHSLSDFKQAATAVGVGSRPAYFHAMYTEAMEKRRAEDAIRSISTPAVSNVSSAAGPQTVGDLFATRPPSRPAVVPNDTRARMIADAEKRGVPVPEYIRSADIREVSRWWAHLPAEVPTLKN